MDSSPIQRLSEGVDRCDASEQRLVFRFRRLLAGLLAYLGVMAFVLSFLFEAVSLDTSEQVLWTQTLRLGYGIQPPLYTWLQWAIFAVFGVNTPAFVLTKELLIATTAITTYFIAKRITLDPRIAGLALISFLFIPQFSYESQRDLTHSILTCSLAALELYLALKLIEERPPLYTYVLFGLIAGLGLLAKYSYGLFLFALCFAMLSLPEIRPAILNRRFWLAVLIAVALFASHGLWLWTAFDPELQEQMAHKLQTPGETQALADVGRGLSTLIKVIAGFFALLIPVYGWAFFFRNPRRSRPAQHQRVYEILLARLLLFQLVLLLGLVRTSEPIALAVWQGEAMPPALAALLSKVGAQDLLAQQARLIRIRYHYSQRTSATFRYLARSL